MAPKRRGPLAKQPPLRAEDDETAESGSAKEVSPKSSKGRGRAQKQNPAPAPDDDSVQAQPSQPTKRRGRSLKSKAAKTEDDATSLKPTKRRGRAPKQPKAANGSTDDVPSESPPKRSIKQQQQQQQQKRGRSAPKPDDEEVESMDTARSVRASPGSSPPPTNAGMNSTMDAEKHLVAAMKPLSLKRKAEDSQIDLTPLKRARAGRVFVFGTGECAQLGLTEDKTERKFPAPVDLNDRIFSVACGGIHNVAVTSEGEVWTWGCNDEKALGRSGDEWVPGKVPMPIPAVKVTAGDSHSMALGADGRVYTWGAYRDTNGLMGFNPNTGEPCATPIPVFFQGKKVVDIASGVNHSLVLLENGYIYEWGHIRIGQRIARHHRMNLLQPRLVNVRNFGRVTRIFAGAYQSFALTDAHKVFAFGMNQYGQSGVDGKNKEQLHKPEEVEALRGLHVVKIAGGLHHSLALLADGRVLSFGRNNYGELGMGDLDQRQTPTLVPGLENIVDIACGSTHSLAVSRSGQAFSCGFGEMLQLGNGEAEDRKAFEKVGGQQIENQDVVACAAGAQHSVLIVSPRLSSA